MKKSKEIHELIKAKIAFQQECPTIYEGKRNDKFSSSYATLDYILEVINPILSKHGLTIIQYVESDSVCTGLYHKSGQFIETDLQVLDPTPVISKAGNSVRSKDQDFGVSVTYRKRYQLESFLGLSTTKDVDGSSETIIRERKKPVFSNKDLLSMENALKKGSSIESCLKWLESYQVDTSFEGEINQMLEYYKNQN